MTTIDEAPVQAPSDIKDVAIHLSYMRRDMAKMQGSLDNITSNYVPIPLFLELKTEVGVLKLENDKRKEFQDTLKGKMWGVGVMAGAIVGVLQLLVSHFWK